VDPKRARQRATSAARSARPAPHHFVFDLETRHGKNRDSASAQPRIALEAAAGSGDVVAGGQPRLGQSLGRALP
jgi:hypothetical protein